MAKSIVPDSHANRLNFLIVLLAQINANAVALGLDPAFVASITTNILNPLIAAYQTLVDAETAATVASANAATLYAAKDAALHGLFNTLKTNPNCTGGMAAAMGLAPASTPHPAAVIKPRIKAEAQPGHVRISGTKAYAELVNIYMRLVGTIAWTLVGIKRKKLPFDDQTPLKVAGTPETREYMARGVINDEEVGIPSDIVTATFAG